MFTGAPCIGMFGSRWDVAPHISAPPRATHRHRLASLCANDPDNNRHGDDGDDDEAMLFNINSIRSLYCEIKLQD